MRSNRTIFSLAILIVLLIIGSAWGNKKIAIERLGVNILIPNNYEIIPRSQWQSDAAVAQQFILKNPVEYDYLVQKKAEKGKDTRLFETSYFLIKSKQTREITDKEFKYYVDKYYFNWDAEVKEKQNKGLLSNLLKSEVIQFPKVDYQNKTVSFKIFLELGEIKETRLMYSSFFSSGNLVIVFTPASKLDESDFDLLIENIAPKN